MRKNTYYSLVKQENSATINIYGDITSFPWFDNDVSMAKLSKQLDELTDVNKIAVYINSYGGEVAEGLAIYNALKRHKAKVKTYCDGFACSIASVIFMAGDERIMNDSSLLMIHNAWSYAQGNAQKLRKKADDLDKITQASVTAYKAHSTLTEEEIKELLDNETWILPEEAIEYGFATAIDKTENEKASQSAKMSLFDIIKQYRQELEKGTDPEDDETDPEQSEEEEETEEEETEEETETEDENKDEEANQKLIGFFNALTK